MKGKLKKVLTALVALAMGTVFALSGCQPAEGTHGGDLGLKDYGLDEKYVPVAPDVQHSGKVDVHLVFGETLAAWENVVTEYSKLQPKVRVVLTAHTSSEYGELLRQEVFVGGTDWDIFHGNYIGATVDRYAYDIYADLSTRNAYAGNQIWKTVLEQNAYTTDTTGRKITYIMNSESLLTAWFANREAFAAAGLTDASGAAAVPETWDDLMDACAKLQAAGYAYPLGIAGDNDSITYSQFCWLLRVYGDQYFRDMLQKIQPVQGDYCYSELMEPFELDLNAEQPEAEDNYLVNVARKYWTILDKTSPDFVGPESEKYGEFISQLAKMIPYVSPTFATDSLDGVRANFVANRADKTSPVILLDYFGNALEIANSLKQAGDRAFTLDMFDYPYMEGENVKTSFMRDVGGNGGYLSVMDLGNEQTAVSLDFLKFFMSPYGQSAYYEGLLNSDATPDGVSTVKHFEIPAEWNAIFSSEKISFTGLCDMNPYTSAMLWTIEGRATVTQTHAENIRKVFAGQYSVSDFQKKWQSDIEAEYGRYFSEMGYKADCYLHPERNPV